MPSERKATPEPGPTLVLDHSLRSGFVRGFELHVVEGPQKGAVFASNGDRCAIGSHASNDLVLDDPTVSRFHCEVMSGRGLSVRDVGSSNGTVLDGVVVAAATPREGSVLRLGRSALRFRIGAVEHALPVSERNELGSLVGASVAMRTTFALLERAAQTDSTVLLEGETGCGKEGAAAALHDLGARRDRPFVVVDCGAIPPELLESELFGHERGAFTGAFAQRSGAFQDAHAGTIFLDEIGELPLDLQPKLLRALESRQVRRVGASGYQPVDVRVIAATNRDLRAEVNAGRFRADLFFRLAIVRIEIPPLRARPEDLPLLVDRLLPQLTADDQAIAALQTPAFLASLARGAWPGNVRELRNHLERCLVFRQALPLAEGALTGEAGEAGETGNASDADERGEAASRSRAPDAAVPYAVGRRQAIEAWERAYVGELLRRHDGSVAAAARASGIGRAYLYRLANRYQLLRQRGG